MLYLLDARDALLLAFLLAALALGLGVGFFTSGPARPVRGAGGPLWALALFVAGLVALAVHLLPGRLEVGLETALMLVAAYAGGCCLGCLVYSAFHRAAPGQGEAPLALEAPRLALTQAAFSEQLEPQELAARLVAADRRDQSAEALRRMTELGDVPVLAAATTQLTGVKPTPDPAAPVAAKPQAAAPAAGGLPMENNAAASPASAATAAAMADMTQAAAAAIAPQTAPPETAERAHAAALAVGEDDLRLIQGIGPAAAKKLVELGVRRFGQIAGWTEEQGRWIGQILGHPGQVEHECWILQARLLAAGVDTDFARAVKSGETSLPEGEGPLGESEAERLDASLPRPIAPQPSDEIYAGLRPLGLLAPLRGESDDLEKISGVDTRTAERLHALGVWTFGQIACWTPEHSRWIGSYLAVPGKIEREKWVDQARQRLD